MITLSIALDGKLTPQIVQAALVGLALVSLRQMQEKPLPLLYASGIRYKREPLGRERWQCARETWRRKEGDCEDLTAYLCAELWLQGERGARPYCYAPRPGLIHCVVRRADGRLEDPSQKLGMGVP